MAPRRSCRCFWTRAPDPHLKKLYSVNAGRAAQLRLEMQAGAHYGSAMNMSPFENEHFCREEAGLDRFFSQKNVAFYRALADRGTDAAARRRILQQLKEEETKFRLEFKRPAADLSEP